MKVTIVGSGHGGCAMAAFLAKRGFDVRLLKLSNAIHCENFNFMQIERKIQLTGIEGDGEYRLVNVGKNPEELIRDVDLVIIYYVANFHPVVAKKLSPYFNDNQCVILTPGYAGSLLFQKEMKRIGNKSLPLFAEFETLPFTSRIVKPGHVIITSKNMRHPFATNPGSRSQEFNEHFGHIIGDCIPRTHILEVGLHNPNLIIHTIGMLMNIALVENPDKTFAMYKDGFTSSMWKLVFKLDEEKMNVLEKVGAPPIPYFDEFRLRTFENVEIDPYKGFLHYANESPDGPFSLDHRYITEDVPMGLGLLQSLGKATGVKTPICDSLINIANALFVDRDFIAEARTLESIWEGDIDSLLKYIA